jgi:RNA polymerase sigma-70 factor (ECF subfamily)
MEESPVPTTARAPDPDSDLVRRARGGEYDAFQALVDRHERDLYRLAMRIVRQRQDAEDVVQDTFLSVMEHLGDFREESTFRTWVVRIATNHALNLLRKRRGTVTVSPEAGHPDGEEGSLPHPEFIAPWRDNPEEIAGRKETGEVLARALGLLDEKHLAAFVLRDLEGMSTEDAARTLGISEANVRVRLFRARLALREELTRAFGDESRKVTGGHSHE